jgi:hypothetical protein
VAWEDVQIHRDADATNVGLPANVIDTNYNRGRTQSVTVHSHPSRLRDTVSSVDTTPLL